MNDTGSICVLILENLGDKFLQYRWNIKNGNRLHNLQCKSAEDVRKNVIGVWVIHIFFPLCAVKEIIRHDMIALYLTAKVL